MIREATNTEIEQSNSTIGYKIGSPIGDAFKKSKDYTILWYRNRRYWLCIGLAIPKKK